MAEKETKRTVLIIITLDTKGDEARFLKERILEDGLDVLVLDSGILGEPRGGIVPDIPASETARAAGTTLEELRMVHALKLLSDWMEEGKVRIEKRLPAMVTYHDPCALARYCEDLDSPRKILSALFEGGIREMATHKRMANCCGEGGMLPHVSPHELFKAFMNRKQKLSSRWWKEPYYLWRSLPKSSIAVRSSL